MIRLFTCAYFAVAIGLASSSAAIFHYDSETAFVKTKANVAFESATRAFPVHFVYLVDTTERRFDLVKLDVFNDNRTEVGFSLAPLSVDLAPRPSGGFIDDLAADFTIDGVAMRVLWEWGIPRHQLTFATPEVWPTGGIPFEYPLLPDQPHRTQWRFHSIASAIPEPSAYLLSALTAVGVILVRRRSLKL